MVDPDYITIPLLVVGILFILWKDCSALTSGLFLLTWGAVSVYFKIIYNKKMDRDNVYGDKIDGNEI